MEVLNERTKGWFLAPLSALDSWGVLFKSTVFLDWQGFQTSSVRHQAHTDQNVENKQVKNWKVKVKKVLAFN